MENAYSLSDIRAAVDGENDHGWGGGSGLWVILFFLLMMGNNGNLLGHGGSSGVLNTDFSVLERKLDGLANGICSAQYENARLANQTDMAMLNGFNQTQMAMQQGFAQQQQCCCETQRAIDGVNYNVQQAKCDITTAIHAEGEKTRSMIQQDKIECLQQQVQQLQLQSAMCGVVRYPQTVSYNAGVPPFFGNNCCCNNGCQTTF